MSKSVLTENLYEEIFKHIAAERMDEIAGEYPSDSELDGIEFSAQFEKRMRRYFNKLRRKYNRPRCIRRAMLVAACILVFLAVSSAVVLNVEALRVPVLNFIREIGDKSTSIYVYEENADYSTVADKIQGMYVPFYVPSGFSIKRIINDEFDKLVSFTDKNRHIITFRNVTAGLSMGIDSENAEIKEITVNGEEATIYFKQYITSLLFSFGDLKFFIAGYVTEDEIIKMAESLKVYS